MEQKLKSKEELVIGDILKRKDKIEYPIIRGDYYFDSSPNYKYIMFDGYSVPKDYLHNFVEMENGKFIVFKKGETLWGK